MKILFITHCHGNYGASKSLQLLLKNIKGHSITLIVPKQIQGRNNLKEIKEFYGDNVSEIKEFYLPFKYCYMGGPETAGSVPYFSLMPQEEVLVSTQVTETLQ
ncbi:MAG: hypothetical protein WAX69_15725 [Victivallales bacterium]